MLQSGAQPLSEPQGRHLVLYDDVCGLCSRLLQFLLRHDHRLVFNLASLQSRVGRSIVARSGGNPEELTSFYVVADYKTAASRVLTRSNAALFVAGALDWPWKAVQFIRFVPRGLRDHAYDVVARSRYRVFGGHDRCLAPSPQVRRRFIDR